MNSLDFEVVDDGPVAETRYVAVDQVTRQRLVGWGIAFRSTTGRVVAPAVVNGECAVDVGSLQPWMTWDAWCEGYISVFGSMGQLTHGTGVTGAGAEIPIEFVSGFHLVLDVRSVDNNPLSGVAVISDGRRLGQTDNRGIFDLRLDRWPSRLELEKDGWCSDPVDSMQPLRIAQASAGGRFCAQMRRCQ
jgi:hypothetical protein